LEGLAIEALPDARFRVQLDAGHEIVAYTAGRMKKDRIKTLANDRGNYRNVAARSGEGTTDLSVQG
jgi:translation initiation factor IF-1